jgi:hypothetical protein
MSDTGRLIDGEDPVSRAVQDLARYMLTNPFAVDTREGITQWWLGLDASSIGMVELALTRLQGLGLIEAVSALDGHVRYRRIAQGVEADEQLRRLADPPIS